ncbi:hypothetical protein [Sediminitomix flava]|uniref:Outer membrane protein with beta-barrel domain n=1 Tax=Sediminitomix flava TaxID=379075 RepID=A0A315YZ17_SEDFL|nr:hypothetical protein [Sediminitomix flava]PWJ34148.1 hypothetical protein BC781_11158 [Sediminitomix flava]
MKLIKGILLVVLLAFTKVTVVAQQSTEIAPDSTRNKWIPDYAYMQFAGGQGLLSLGAGYKLGKRERGYLDLGYGFVPSGVRGRAKNIVNLKYSTWLVHPIQIKPNMSLELLGLGLASSWYFGPEHTSLKEGYPEGYYWFSHATDLRFSVGARYNYDFCEKHLIKRVTLYGDLGRTILYSVNQFKNPEMLFNHFVNASVGVLLHFD